MAADWMKNLPLELKQVSFSKLAIPGSHNSFTSELITTPLAGSSAQAPDLAKDLGAMAGFIPPSVLKNWSTTQTLGATEQLQLGIRFFDCRLTFHPGEGEFRFCHGLYGARLSGVLDEIVSFLEIHDGEVVVLDFNHLFGHSQEEKYIMDEVGLAMFSGQVSARLAGMMAHEDCLHSSLEHILATGKRVVVFCHHELGIAFSDDAFCHGRLCHSYWPNVDSCEKMLNYTEVMLNSPTHALCSVTQGVLTPSLGMIMSNLSGNLKDTCAADATRRFTSWLEFKSRDRNFTAAVNFCIADFVETPGYVTAVIALNQLLLSRA